MPKVRVREVDAFAAPLPSAPLDVRSIAWDDVASATYRIEQRFAYAYPGPIRNLRHRLVLSPPVRHGAQRRLSQHLAISPDLPSVRHADAFGNDVFTLAVPHVESSFAVTYSSLVRCAAPLRGHYEPAQTLDDPKLRSSGGLTRCDDAMREFAIELRREHPDTEACARAIARFAFERIAYSKDATDVSTTAIEAFHLRRGVCQDHAHVTLALARAVGIACRYVSGHLLGEGATHAWVEFLIPDVKRARVLAIDPTHDRDVTMRYVTVAVGRDYNDVAPTSGAYEAPYAGTFSARHAVSVAAVSYRR